jgi:hypothetical protein
MPLRNRTVAGRILTLGVASLLLLGAAGCQTFRLSDEEFLRQQMGRYDDDTAGALFVEILGNALAAILPPCH